MHVSTITPHLACPDTAKRAHRDHDEPVSSVLLGHFRRCPSVREGGVEPPRPFGHWNLNPARLPIPPPAHWVCLRAVPPGGWRLPTCRRLARCPGWIHIPYPPPVTCPGDHRHPLRTPRTSRYVSTWAGSRINLVPVGAISPGGGQGPQSGAGHLSAAPSTILGRSSAEGVRRADKGEPADLPARGYDQ